MRHVWLLNHYANPPSFAGSARHHSLAKYLPDHGWRMTLLVSSVIHHSDRQLLQRGTPHELQTVEGVPYLRLRVPRYTGNSVRRLMNMAGYCLRALDPRSTDAIGRPDLVVGSSVHPFAALTGSMLARRYGVPFVFEVRDLWPETMIARGRMAEGSPTARVFCKLEEHLYHQAAYTISLLPQAHDYIARYGIPAERVVWIPNGVDWKDYAEPLPKTKKDTFDFMYFGAHGISNDLDVLIDAFHGFEKRYTGRKTVRLRMIGDGPTKADLQARAAGLGIRNILFESTRPRGEVPQLAAEADAFVLVLRDLGRLYRYGISLNKLYDYLAAGRPVVSASAAGNDPVAEAGAGLSVPPEVNPLTDALLQMASMHHATRAAMGRAGRRFMKQNHDLNVLAGRFAKVLDDACAGR